MSVINQHNLAIFRQSLQRVSASTEFFDCFYNSFVAQSDEIGEFFKNRDMKQLKKKLRETLFMLAETAEGRPGLTLYIEMLGRVHLRLKVKRKHFVMWEEALLEAVKRYDKEFDDKVLAAWLEVIDNVIETMFRALDETKQMAS
ncbi:MAG: globin [Candidatus Thiodiazotropha sp. (ex Ctena orbiculata)]|uniref:Globin n=1 Tax=Candidatus Thiodiazotropha taylori TaxID=2792791 RepID=A0A944M930_9GAMM|nr:globin [Candidatus Thiodiazotropha taylori]MBT2989503.1 globin [Candidatus Thiodiazotropha taylori]MBT2997083.1 globin [Candidatus Thiodiazotropha taylori]MBT3001237.1 globin [Candidatus Thiodiazotropha taylori]MBV2107081.1 globin [Candidatus Thiodiazotropha taylori]